MVATPEETNVGDRLSDFVRALDDERRETGARPAVEVRCDFSCALALDAGKANRTIQTVPGTFARAAMKPFEAMKSLVARAENAGDKKTTLEVLRDARGCFRPGTLTLVLAPPGHGKSTLLKSIAGVNPLPIEGEITYSGLTKKELEAKGVSLHRLCEYVTQLDEHLPYLTVKETVQFSHENACHVPSDAEGKAAYDDKVDKVINLLNLDGCKDTIIGNDLIRGVSGGEKKRVTIAEAMVKNAQVLCMDEISTGLDAAVTYNIVAGLKEWASRTQGTGIIALLQPTPEVVSLFDDVLLLKEGATVYHGPVDNVATYFKGLGFAPPAVNSGADLADWLISLLVSPTETLLRAGTQPSDAIPTNVDAMVKSWQSTQAYESSIKSKCTPADIELNTPFAKNQYSLSYPRSFADHFKSVFKRQAQVTLRNKLFLQARIFGACVTSLILGSVWFDLPLERGFEKLGMLLFCILHISFSNFSELTFSVEQKYVAFKHLDAKLFPELSYLASWALVHLPIAIVETLIFSCVLYPMVGLNLAFKQWGFFYLQLVLANVAMASFFRVIALVSPTMEVAQIYPGPFIAVMILFAGFLISPELMGGLEFMYWVSIFAYCLRSLCQNEFLSGHYNVLVPNDPITAATFVANNPQYSSTSMESLCRQNLITPCSNMGEIILDTIGITKDTSYKWAGPAFCLGFFALTFAVGLRTLHTTRIQRNIGSSRAEDKAQNDEEVIQMIDVAAAQKAMDFTAMAISWKDLCYTVEVAAATPKSGAMDDSTTDKKEKTVSKQLLHNISSAAQPGRMLALMGSSGAGKTTLLDVIAGRKNTGLISGDIKLNGHNVKQETFARLTAYCEQMDLHNEFTTVREALEFSAKLRLHPSISDETRVAFVDEALEILELNSIAHRMIGTSGSDTGLAPGQRKVLTVAVELVSNAPVFFLDEPTSGLDARSALIVMKEVKKVAALGRTVISTIHQPSMEIFLMFDDMLLLQRGGYQVYFGELGKGGSTMVNYLQSLKMALPLPSGMNPASWMLDVLGGSDSSGGASRKKGSMKRSASGIALDGLLLDQKFMSSAEGQAAMKLVNAISEQGADEKMFSFDSPYARTFKTQLLAILSRANKSQLRDVGYNCGRISILTILYILFGVIYLDLKITDEAGVQSMVACVFMTTIFTGIICMNSVMPVRVRERAVAFRERSSYMYDAIPFSLATAIIEVPWIAIISLVTVIPMYFLVGMIPTAQRLFFHILVNFLVSFTFLSFGQAVACMCSTIETAQAGTSAFIPIAFLFGGLYLPLPQIPVYWQWAYYINPVAYAIQSVVAPQFERRGCSGPYPSGNCPTIQAFRGSYFETIDTLTYVEQKYEIKFSERWISCGYLAIFAFGMQFVHSLFFKTSNVVKR